MPQTRPLPQKMPPDSLPRMMRPYHRPRPMQPGHALKSDAPSGRLFELIMLLTLGACTVVMMVESWVSGGPIGP